MTLRKILLWGTPLWGLLIGFIFFMQHLSVGTPCQGQRDLIVVLTGDKGRIEKGLDLLENSWAHQLFISGIHASDRAQQILQNRANQLNKKIILGAEAYDTIGNAREVATWHHSHPFHTFYLVTSDYHMPRSVLTFQTFFPHATLCPYAVAGHDDRSVLFLLGQYLKFIGAFLYYRIVL